MSRYLLDGFVMLLIAGIAAAVFYATRLKRRLARDIADRKQSEQREKTRNHVLELLAHGAPLATILEAIVRGVEQEQPDMLCSILLLDSEGKHLVTGAAPSLPDFYNVALNGAGNRSGSGFFRHRRLHWPACHRRGHPGPSLLGGL